jgi:MFS family permease
LAKEKETPAVSLTRDRRNVLILAVSQGLFVTGQSMLIILSGLVGSTLAADPALATLPVSTVVVGTLAATVSASLLMRRIGRRAGFLLGAAIALAGAVTAAYAVYIAAFWLFAFGTFLVGVNAGFAMYFRFAAADVAAPAFRSRAISLVLAGGVVAAVAGPQLVRLTVDALAPIAFLGAYVALAVLPVFSALFLAFLDIPLPAAGEGGGAGRPLTAIVRQPAFVVAVLGGMVGYGVMSLVMTATPLAMVGCGFAVPDAAMVIQWHVLAMFAPSFVTGAIIQRVGVLNVMLAGMGLLAACVAAALAGIDIANFAAALVALGLGWNFAFVGASTLLTETYRPAERAKVQAANDFLVFGSVATASLSSGAVLHFFGWDAVQVFALPFVAVATSGLLWLKWLRRRAVAAEAV